MNEAAALEGDSRIREQERHATVMEAIEVSWQDSGYAGSARLSRAAHAAADAVLAALNAPEARQPRVTCDYCGGTDHGDEEHEE